MATADDWETYRLALLNAAAAVRHANEVCPFGASSAGFSIARLDTIAQELSNKAASAAGRRQARIRADNRV